MTHEFRSIEDEWQRYSEMIFKGMRPPPSKTQVDETKKAFFAGAWMMVKNFYRAGELLSEDDAVKYFSDRLSEGERFSRDLIRRYSEKN